MSGDWSDTQPKNNTDRTASTIELVEKIEKLSKQLEIAVEILDRFAFDYDDTTGPIVFIENARIALRDIKELEK